MNTGRYPLRRPLQESGVARTPTRSRALVATVALAILAVAFAGPAASAPRSVLVRDAAEYKAALPTLRLVGTRQEFSRTSNRICMSNSFAFGGSNASLLIGDAR